MRRSLLGLLAFATVLSLDAATANAKEALQQQRLACTEKKSDRRMSVLVRNNGLILWTDTASGKITRVDPRVAQLLIQGDFAALDKKSTPGEEGAEVSFAIRGQTFDGHPTLTIAVKSSLDTLILNSCLVAPYASAVLN